MGAVPNRVYGFKTLLTLLVLEDEGRVCGVFVHHDVIDGLDVGADGRVAALVDYVVVPGELAQLVPAGPRHVQDHRDALVQLSAHCNKFGGLGFRAFNAIVFMKYLEGQETSTFSTKSCVSKR